MISTLRRTISLTLLGSFGAALSAFASITMGWPLDANVLLFIASTVFIVYGLDGLIDSVRVGQGWPPANVAFLVGGLIGVALTAPQLTGATWYVVLIYGSLGLLWTVRFIPTVGAGRRITLAAPRDLACKPLLCVGAFALAVYGVPLAQLSELPALPMGERSPFSPALYVLLNLAFMLGVMLSNALTMDLADFDEASEELRSSGFVSLGETRARRLQRLVTWATLILGVAIAASVDNPAVSAPVILLATYSFLSTRAVARSADKWIRAIACDAIALPVLAGIAASTLIGKVTPLARPFEGLLIEAPAQWAPWVLGQIITGAVLWSVAYVLIIRAAAQDRCCGMPPIVLFVNITWELHHAFITPEPFPSNVVNVVWFCLDVIILLQLIRHAPAALARRGISPLWVAPAVVAAMVLGYTWQVGFDLELANRTGEYSAFVAETVMAALFLHWGLTSRDLRGQRVSIGVAKGLGSAFYVVPVLVTTGSLVLVSNGLLTLALDTAYVLVLLKRRSLQRERAPVATVPDHLYCATPLPGAGDAVPA